MSQVNEYRHSDGVNTAGVVAGTEHDLVLAADPQWELVGESQPEPEATEPEGPVETDEDTKAPEPTDDPAEGIDPGDYSREELNAIAAEKGIEDPEGFGTKAEVVEAINAAE